MRSVLVSGDSLGKALWPPVNAVTDTKEDSSMKGNDGGRRAEELARRAAEIVWCPRGAPGGWNEKRKRFFVSIHHTPANTKVLVIFLSPTIYTIS